MFTVCFVLRVFSTLTSTAVVAQVRESPNITESHGVTHRGQDELQPAAPCGSLSLCGHLEICST